MNMNKPAAQFPSPPDSAGAVARIGDLVPSARAALATLPAGQARDDGDRAIGLVERFVRGEAIDPRAIEETLMDEDENGLLIYDQTAPDAQQRNVWAAVTAVVGYAAWVAYDVSGQHPGALVENFGVPEALDIVEDALRTAREGAG